MDEQTLEKIKERLQARLQRAEQGLCNALLAEGIVPGAENLFVAALKHHGRIRTCELHPGALSVSGDCLGAAILIYHEDTVNAWARMAHEISEM